MANPFVHVELSTTDLGAAKKFYQALFDWKLEDVDMGGGSHYTIINVPIRLAQAGQPSVAFERHSFPPKIDAINTITTGLPCLRLHVRAARLLVFPPFAIFSCALGQ